MATVKPGGDIRAAEAVGTGTAGFLIRGNFCGQQRAIISNYHVFWSRIGADTPRQKQAKEAFRKLEAQAGSTTPLLKRKHALAEIGRLYQGLGGQPVSSDTVLKDTLNTVMVDDDIVGYSPYREAGQGHDYALAFLDADVQTETEIRIQPEVVAKAEPSSVHAAGKPVGRSIVSGEDPSVGLIVYKLGGKTGFTAGKVTKVAQSTFEVEYIAHLGFGGAFFSATGDSGSPVFSILPDGGLVLRGIIAQVGAGETGGKTSSCALFTKIDAWLKADFGGYQFP